MRDTWTAVKLFSTGWGLVGADSTGTTIYGPWRFTTEDAARRFLSAAR